MPDVYATIAQADETVQEQLAGVLELRAADPQQIAMRDAYLAQVIPEPERALAEAFRVLEVPGQLAIFDGDYATQPGNERRPTLCRRVQMQSSAPSCTTPG